MKKHGVKLESIESKSLGRRTGIKRKSIQRQLIDNMPVLLSGSLQRLWVNCWLNIQSMVAKTMAIFRGGIEDEV